MSKLVSLDCHITEEATRWQTAVSSFPHPSVLDSPQWCQLIQDFYRFPSWTWLSADSDQAQGLSTLYRVSSFLLGDRLINSPFFGTSGFHFKDPATLQLLLNAGVDLGRERDVDFIEIRSRTPLPEPFQHDNTFALFDLSLDQDIDDIWHNRLSSNVRQNIRRSAKNAYRFESNTDPEIAHAVLARTLRIHGTPFHGKTFFQRIRDRLGDQVSFSCVEKAGKPVAAALVIWDEHSMSTPYIGSLEPDRSEGVGYFQYWELIKEGVRRGKTKFEFGRSPRKSTHASYKKKWGAGEIPLFHNYLLIGSGTRYRTVGNPSKLELTATKLWSHLPLILTRYLGPGLQHHIA